MMDSVKNSQLTVAGFYTQPYNHIVKPEQVWVVSKYFLRRWVPYYLGPTRFWAAVAARHLAYFSHSKKMFQAHDARVYKESGCSKRTYARVKGEMGDSSNPLSLFVQREDAAYESHDGKVRPAATTYHVRLDDVLTPGDATHLSAWLQAQKIERSPTAVGELLTHMLTLPSTELLAPSLRPYAADPPAQYKPITAADVVRRVFGNKMLEDETVFEKCDALHTHLTGTAYIGRQYFRQAWVNELGAGPAYLLVYLRSYCFQDEAEGKLRNEIATTRPDLAEALGVDRVTLFRWLKKIESQTPDAQPFAPFLEEVESSRIAGNDVEIRLKVELREPLTAESLKEYRILVTEIESLLQNGTHENGEETAPALQNGTHEAGEASELLLQNGAHENEGIRLLLLQNGTHEQPGVAKWHSRTGSALQNGTTGVAKWHTFKHYKHLIFKTLSEEAEESTLAASAAQPEWKLDGDKALCSFAEAAVEDLEGFCDVVGIHGSPRRAVCDSTLSVEQAVSWYLYALTQPKLTKANSLPGYIVNRLRENARPPIEFEMLATRSWELWRCYACLLNLSPSYLDAFERDAVFVSWFTYYGRFQPDDLPLGVGEGVTEFVDQLVELGEESSSFVVAPAHEYLGTAVLSDNEFRMSPEESSLWKAGLGELSMQLTKATFNTWLKDSRLHLIADGQAVIFVRNEYAADWIRNRLKPTIDRTLTAVAGKDITITVQVGLVGMVP
jgi:hypothetical protein